MNPVAGVRLEPDELARIDELAHVAGLTRSTWMRQALLTASASQSRRIHVLAQVSKINAGEAQRGVNSALTRTQQRVWDLLVLNGSMCRLDFAAADVWEVSNRISEIEDRLGVEIQRGRCVDHPHRHRVVRYSL